MSAGDDQGWVTLSKQCRIVEVETPDDRISNLRPIVKIEAPDDRISNLPDDVVSHILSRLPTKDALRTSVFSRAWEHKWTSIYDFDIDSTCVSDANSLLFSRSRLTCFANFVTRILDRTCNSRIRRFCLFCENIDNYINIEMWISSVLKRNVEILKINASSLRIPFDAPRYISNWGSLSELELYLSCNVLLPANNCFPNLKKLLLIGWLYIGIKAEKISSEGRIILNFPVLQVLVLKNCEWMDVNFVEIHAPELIKFETICPREPKSYEIRIFGPKLATFRSLYSPIDNFSLCAPVVSCAEITDCQPRGKILQRTQKILNQIPGLTRLKISHSVVDALLTSWPRLVFPTFDRLTELNLCDRGYLCVLLELLKLLPPLEMLHVNVDAWNSCYETEHTKRPWPPKFVSNLKKVELEKFKGSPLELDFSKFVLENARNLEQMSFTTGKKSDMTPEKANYMWSDIKPKSCIFVVSKLRS